MIDTVVIALPRANISMNDRDNKGRQMWDQHTRAKGYEKYVRNPSQTETATGLYFPRIAGINSGNGPPRMKIEFSVPKILYGNNVNEVDDIQFADVLTSLQERLSIMGVDFTTDELRAAAIVAVHYS